MDTTIRFHDDVTVGAQPTIADLKELAEQSIKTIVNFRHEGEDHQPLSPDEEGEQVEQLGMDYLHIPVSMKSLTPALVDEFREAFRDVAKPVFAHCKMGTRAGLMLIMKTASEQGLSGEQAIQKAKSMGFKPDKPETEQFIRDYVDSRSTGAK